MLNLDISMNNNLEDISPGLFRKRILLSLFLPVILISILWVIRFIEYEFGISFHQLGIFPHSLKGLPGILFSPMIHEDARHLFNNSLPLLILGSALFYFYTDIAFRVLGFSWLVTGILVWLVGRESWHIGASGLVYSLAAFLFVSGLIRRYMRLLALSLLVAYLYGSMVWGMFPFMDIHISWEAHMMGAISGVVMALWYRKEGPQKPEPLWLDEDEDEDFHELYDITDIVNKPDSNEKNV
jgi:membrane associated rhomboid family serine protease